MGKHLAKIKYLSRQNNIPTHIVNTILNYKKTYKKNKIKKI